eukprot:4400463-Amphidinium_carterae.1
MTVRGTAPRRNFCISLLLYKKPSKSRLFHFEGALLWCLVLVSSHAARPNGADSVNRWKRHLQQAHPFATTCYVTFSNLHTETCKVHNYIPTPPWNVDGQYETIVGAEARTYRRNLFEVRSSGDERDTYLEHSSFTETCAQWNEHTREFQ